MAIVVVVVVVHEPHLVDKVEIIAQLVPRVTLSRSACTHKHRRALDITRALRSSQSLLRVSYQPRVDTDLPTLHEYRPALPRPRIDEPRASFAADVARERALQPSPLRRAFVSTSSINVAITSSEA